MHRSTISFLRRSISQSPFHRPSPHSPQSSQKIHPSAPSLRPSIPKPHSSPSKISGTCALTLRPTAPNPLLLRGLCSNQPIDYGKEVDEINLKFAEAREEIDAALESKETVYFDEEAECAREAVKSVFDMFEGLLARLPERDGLALQRSMGLKMEQLKAELKQLDD